MNRTSYIYKLVSTKTPLVYIGSTSQPLHKRFNGHRAVNNQTKSKILFDYGKDDVKIIQVAKFENISKEELTSQEYSVLKQYEEVAVNFSGTKGYVGLTDKESIRYTRKILPCVQCEFCNKTYANKYSLKSHITKKHKSIKIFDFDVITF